MIKTVFLKSRIFLLLMFFINASNIRAEVPKDLKKQVGFVENLGQLKRTDGKIAEEVLFYANLPGGNIFFTKSAIVYDFVRMELSLMIWNDRRHRE